MLMVTLEGGPFSGVVLMTDRDVFDMGQITPEKCVRHNYVVNHIVGRRATAVYTGEVVLRKAS